MMAKYIMIGILIAGLAGVIYFYILGRASQNQPMRQHTAQLLEACPSSPNCVCSEYPDDESHYVMPINLSPMPQLNDLSVLEDVVVDQGGQVMARAENYFAAIFQSPLFGFVDDFEARLDPISKQIHIRSASRVGRSDFGANKKRVENIKDQFMKLVNKQS